MRSRINESHDGAIPRLTLFRLISRFLRFGVLAWGGPIAQIAMLRRELVDQEGWISPARFNRTLAVYQLLPGPEAQELTIFFGTLARGRLGGLLAGLCFLLPGFVLMLGLSWVYADLGIGSPAIAAAFAGCQAAVLALIVRGLERIGSRTLYDRQLWLIAGTATAASLAGIHFLVPLALGGITFPVAVRGHRSLSVLALLAALSVVVTMTVLRPNAEQQVIEGGGTSNPSPVELLASGVRAGALTFGGAYTAIPFVEQDATGAGGWMSRNQFLDGIALSGVIPAPLVIFATFVGFMGGGVVGAVAMSIGIFLPAFAITLIGHRFLEGAIADRRIHAVLDGVAAGVVGLVAATLITFAPVAIETWIGLTIFAVALLALYAWKASSAVAVVMVGAALAGALTLRG